MLGYREHFLKAMTDIEESQKNGHLLGPTAFIEKHKQEEDSLHKATIGSTTHPFFEKVSHPVKTYRLKPNISASVAIESLLESHETFVECGVALNIAYYLVVLRKMEETLGKEEGRKRFDILFGESDRNTPTSRRLIVSPLSIIMGTQALPAMEQLPVQPLSYFVEEKNVVTKSAIKENAQIGWQIVFAGDPNYPRIHPAGHHGAYNCVVTSLNPLKVRVFDLGNEELIEDDLYRIHMQAYSETPSFESFFLLAKKFRKSKEFFEMINKTTRENIPGFIPDIFAINEMKLNFLLSGEIAEVTEALDGYIHTTLKTVRKQYLELRHSNSEAHAEKLLEDLKRMSLVFTEPLVNESTAFSGLTGLRGMFVSKAKPSLKPKQPANSARKVESKGDDVLANGLKRHLASLIEEKPLDVRFRNAANDGDLNKVKMLWTADIVNVQGDTTGQTALHRAASKGHIAIVEWLLENHADPKIPDFKGNTPYLLAAKFSSIQIILAKHPDAKKAQAFSALHKHLLNESRMMYLEEGISPPAYDPKSDCLRVYKGKRL